MSSRFSPATARAIASTLHSAVNEERVPDILLLMKAGLNLDARNDAESRAHFEEVVCQQKEYIAKRDAERDAIWGSHLHFTVYYGLCVQMQNLLESGVDVNAKGLNGNSALHVACEINQIQIDRTGNKDGVKKVRNAVIRLLLLHGADVNAQNTVNVQDDFGEDASLYDSDESEHDSDGSAQDTSLHGPNLYESGGKTPLHAAVTESNIKMIKLFLRHGADISIQDGMGYNSLHWAVEMYTVALCCSKGTHSDKLLIEKAGKVVHILLAHGTPSDKVAHLSATTYGEYDGAIPGDTPQQLAPAEKYFNDDDDMKKTLRDALVHAEQSRRVILEEFTMGYHARVGAASHIVALTPDVMQMIINAV
jgi:hypothetical protein